MDANGQQKAITKTSKWKLAVSAYIIAIAALYFTIGAGLFLFQRNFVFRPSPENPGNPAQHGLRDMTVVDFMTEDGVRLYAWFAPPKGEGKVIVLFHGHSGNLAKRVFRAKHLLKEPFGLFLCEYRGYGGNPGEPSEAGLYRDGRACLKWLKDRGYDHDRLVYYGQSLGTGVAVQMALEGSPSMLVLEAPYSSLLDVIQEKFPVYPIDMMLQDRFDSVGKIARIKAPLLVIHGDRDTTIPVHWGRKLFQAGNEPKEFISIPEAGHNNLYLFGTGGKVINWIEKHAGRMSF